jgi:hypothetical protein
LERRVKILTKSYRSMGWRILSAGLTMGAGLILLRQFAKGWPEPNGSRSTPIIEADMRNIDDIVAAAHKATEASLREAFEAGRARTASELKARMAAFFEGLASEAEAHAAPHAASAGEDHHPEPHQEGHHD